ncbi:MAG: hypothetical protein COB22_07770 [Cycloclasticus sp.]|nr:MAG: hypothetical protein COB22_07770 [Cycloclasticus sp.]
MFDLDNTEKTIKSVILKEVSRKPWLQYSVYMLLGVIRQLQGLMSTRKIGSVSQSPFVFIIGSGRSGNTLLRRLLMEYGDIYIPPESYVLPSEVISHLNACALSWPDRVDLTLAKIEFHPEFPTFEIDTLREFSIQAKEYSKENQQVGTLIVELYKWLAVKKGCSSVWVGDKTPLNTMHLGLLKGLIPNAVYIYIERDGVDVCFSYIESGIYREITEAANRWVSSRKAWQSFKKSISEDSFIEIQYEALVSNHEKVISNILDKLNIPKRDEILTVSGVEMGDVLMRKHHVNVQNSPTMKSVGKGRASLSPEDKLILQRIIGNELIKAGYDSLV